MTFYHTPIANPYRASTGSMPLRVPTSPSRSKYEETCESCGSSYTDEHLLPLNTPFSSSGSLQPPPQHHHRPRRASNSAHEPPKILTRYPNGAIILEPATSYPTHGSERRRRPPVSAPPSPPSHGSIPRSVAHRPWASYYKEISVTEDNAARPGTTRFPRKLVNKDAVKQMGLPFEEERGGAIVVPSALPRSEIERLVELTESIRGRRCCRIIVHYM
ncbi:hypothetical protein BDZ91DRAFT_121627 [Kalaharituber pfeilii]|nr:hypothetical protein BDZ91DRAFT_121627 [Kalaharituber pfeilii]